jgi:hypothetical protein
VPYGFWISARVVLKADLQGTAWYSSGFEMSSSLTW